MIYNAQLNSFVATQKMMVWATKTHFEINGNLLPSNTGETIEVKLDVLQSENLINVVQDPWNTNETCDGYILITEVDTDKYDYTPYLKCQNNYKADGYVADGLIANWKFDGNAYDYTPNDNQGTIHNVVTTTNQYGVPDKALSFNGPSNYVDTNYDYSFSYNTGTTFSLWIKFAMDNTSGKTKNILGKNSWEYLLSQIDNKIVFTEWNSDGSYAIRLTSNTDIQIGKWYNIVVVYNEINKQVYLYINGVIDVYGTVTSSTFEDKKESLKIGRGYPDIGAASSTFFVGVIDNIYLYSRAWSPYEVKLIMI
jgi:hypothetical protein